MWSWHAGFYFFTVMTMEVTVAINEGMCPEKKSYELFRVCLFRRKVCFWTFCVFWPQRLCVPKRKVASCFVLFTLEEKCSFEPFACFDLNLCSDAVASSQVSLVLTGSVIFVCFIPWVSCQSDTSWLGSCWLSRSLRRLCRRKQLGWCARWTNTTRWWSTVKSHYPQQRSERQMDG